jgi:uncharacterized membrane protein YeiB
MAGVGPEVGALAVHRRLVGVDAARALAIVGMVTVHVGPREAGGPLGVALDVPRGRSAILFGLLAGVGVALLASSRTTSVSQARLILLWRAAVLLPLGLWLQTLDHGVYVILADYAVLFLLGLVVMRWSDRWLLAVVAVSTVVGSVGYRYGQLEASASFQRVAAAFGDAPGEIVHRLVLSGPYPLVTWAAPFCLGIWLGRRELVSAVVQRRMVVVGGAVALLVPAVSWALTWAVTAVVGELSVSGWWALLDDAPHSQRPLWLVSASGSAVAVLGLCLVVGSRWPRWLAPLAAAGQLAFTWYVAHLLVLHVHEPLLRTGTEGGTVAVVVVLTVVMVVVSVAWLRVAGAGAARVRVAAAGAVVRGAGGALVGRRVRLRTALQRSDSLPGRSRGSARPRFPQRGRNSRPGARWSAVGSASDRDARR